MNNPPKDYVRVQVKHLHQFVVDAATTAGLSEERSRQLAGWLTDNDLRGVFSHGTQQIATYEG